MPMAGSSSGSCCRRSTRHATSRRWSVFSIALRRAPGVGRVVRPGEFGALGYPEYADNPYVPGHYLIVGDVTTHLVLDAKDATAQRRPRQRPYHGHGYFADHPSMQTALVFSGAGVGRGVSLGQTRNVDVAPTIAALLGVELPTAIGRVLIQGCGRPVSCGTAAFSDFGYRALTSSVTAPDSRRTFA